MEKLKDIRKTIIKIVHKANVSHIGAALSVVDILYTLYYRVANLGIENINDKNRDVIILSKGHASAALYSVLYHKGLLSERELNNYSIDNGSLPCHVDKEKSPFFEVSAGSLGHGPSLGTGFALAKKMDGCKGRVFVICGDGECNEGSVWEALMFASTHHLNNFVFIVDNNHWQGFGATNNVINQSNLKERIEAFGFDTYEIDGHNLDLLEKYLTKESDKPLAIVADTVKGKGVSFMEDRLEWHYKSPNDEQYEVAIGEIEEKY